MQGSLVELRYRFIVFLCAISLVSVTRLHGQQVIEDIGHYTQLGLPIGALGITLIKGDTKGAVQLGKSVLVESVLVYGLKNLIDRPRPNGGGLSFPSGHTALSFTSSTYLYKRYGWEYGIPATVLASFVGYSRYGVDEPRHYFSDVIAGAALGIATSLIFTSCHVDEQKVSLSGGWSESGGMVSAKIIF